MNRTRRQFLAIGPLALLAAASCEKKSTMERADLTPPPPTPLPKRDEKEKEKGFAPK